MDPTYIRFSEVLVGALVGGEATLVLNIQRNVGELEWLPLVCAGVRTLLIAIQELNKPQRIFTLRQTKEERQHIGVTLGLQVACIIHSWDEYVSYFAQPLTDPVLGLALLFLLWLDYDNTISPMKASEIFVQVLGLSRKVWSDALRFWYNKKQQDPTPVRITCPTELDQAGKQIKDKLLKDPAWQAVVCPFVTLKAEIPGPVSLSVTENTPHLERAVHPHYQPGGNYTIDLP